MRTIKFMLVILCCLSMSTLAQEHKIVAFKFGKGLRLTSIDSTFYLKFSARMQNRYDGVNDFNSTVKYKDRFYIRRARLKFDGFAVTPKLVYKIEVDLVGGRMLDAVVKWNFYKGFTVWFGQTKLPGNRERVISSQKLQFVDRSWLNALFTLDRDKGIQLRHQHKIGNVVLREVVSFSMGEGINYLILSDGHDYTARLEVLPFGKFTKNGDYVSADIFREQKPKLALGGTFDFNKNAVRRFGQRGDIFITDNPKDITTWFADMMFKYKGFSVLSEYAYRTTNGSPVVDSTSAYYTGMSVNVQAGYVFNKNWEIAGRYTTVMPADDNTAAEIKEYTVALSKYIVGHSLKVQTDFSYRDEEFVDGQLIWRLQVELSF